MIKTAKIIFGNEEFIENYKKLKSSKKMAKLYGCDKKTITTHAKEIGYDYTTPLLLTPKQKQEILDNYDICSSTYLAEKYGVSRSTILKIWMNSNKRGKLHRHYPLDESYFDTIDSKDKAYFLGFMSADGNVYSSEHYSGDRQNRFSLTLKNDDEYILELFKKYLKTTKPLSYTTKNNKYYDSTHARLEISSNRIVVALAKYNIIPRKSYPFEICRLSEEYMSHYLRGYFDGDGSITFKMPLSRTMVSYTGFVHNLEKIQDYLKTSHNIDMHVSVSTSKQYPAPFGQLRSSNIQTTYNFLKYIYQDCEDLCLTRKKERADNFIKEFDQRFNK